MLPADRLPQNIVDPNNSINKRISSKGKKNLYFSDGIKGLMSRISVNMQHLDTILLIRKLET